MTKKECEELNEKTKMSYFIDSLRNLCSQYNVRIESLCDKSIGTPHAVVSFKNSKTEKYYNINSQDLDYSFGEEIDC